MPGQKPDPDHKATKIIEAEIVDSPPSGKSSGKKRKKVEPDPAVDDKSTGKTYFKSKPSGRSGASDPDKIDPDLVLMLQNCIAATHMIVIEGCRNGSKYAPYMNWDVSKIGDGVARQNAEDIARDIWADIYKHSFRHGPIYRWWIVCNSIEVDAEGDPVPLQSVRIRIDCTRGPEGAMGDDLPVEDSLKSMLSFAATFARETQHMLTAAYGYSEKLLDQNIKLVGALPSAISKAAELSDIGMGVMKTATDYHRTLLDETTRREEQVLIAKYGTKKLEVMSEGIRSGVEIFTGELAALGMAWLTSKGDHPFKDPDSLKEASGMLLDTLTRKQQNVLGASAYTSVVAKLTAASQQPTDVEATAVLFALMPILKEYEAAMKPTLSPEQKVLLGFIVARLKATSAS